VTALPVGRIEEPGFGFMDDNRRDSERRRHRESPSQRTYPSRREPGGDYERRRKEQHQPEQVTGDQRLRRRAAPPGPADSVLCAQIQPADLQSRIERESPPKQRGRRNRGAPERLAPRHGDDASKDLTRLDVLLLHLEPWAPWTQGNL